MVSGVVVLLSGGVDSTAALGVAMSGPGCVLALSVDYGQAHVRELEAAAAVAAHWGVRHEVLDFSSWGALVAGSLVVPNRNAVLLMAGVGVADRVGAGEVWTGVHVGDHEVFPDCRPGFVEAAGVTARLATEGRVGVVAPFVDSGKGEVVRAGVRVDAPFGLSWSCYEGGAVHCGVCMACVGRRAGFAEAGVVDPAVYAG